MSFSVEFNRAIFDELMTVEDHPNRELVEKIWLKCQDNPWNGPILYSMLNEALRPPSA